MKTLVRIFTLTAAVLLSLSVSAQKIEFDINGIILGNIYTKEQIIEKLGNPNEYATPLSDFGGILQRFYYGTNRTNIIALGEDGEFNGFSISSPRFTVIKGTVKVGDPISKITTIVGTRCFKHTDEYQLQFLATPENYIMFQFENGIITCIYGYVPN